MNSYLQMSYTVLGKSRVAMSAREILDAAYRLQLVPGHLFGKTQYKTLHARLSEDILRNRDGSVFTRTAPGRFALRSQMKGVRSTKAEYVAPQRQYQLKHFYVLCAEKRDIELVVNGCEGLFRFSSIENYFKKQVLFRHAEQSVKLVNLKILVIIRSDDSFLTLETNDNVGSGGGRSLGLLGYVKGDDADLFSADALGIDTAARRTIREQSTAPVEVIDMLSCLSDTDTLHCIFISNYDNKAEYVTLLKVFECFNPDEFICHISPSRYPRWTRVPAEVNDISSFEPVSQRIVLSDWPKTTLY